MSREDKTEVKLKETLEKKHYPRSWVYREMLSDCRGFAIMDFLLERMRLPGKDDRSEIRSKTMKLAREKIRAYVEKEIR